MKKQSQKSVKILYAIAAVVLALSMTLNACQTAVTAYAAELSKTYQRTTSEEGEVTEAFTEAFSGFAFRLFTETAKTGAENKLVSPLSAALCLSLIANGAEGETLCEMESLLGMDVESLNKALYAYTESLMNQKDSKMELANSVWFRNSDDALHVEEAFLQKLADWYQAEAYAAPFDETTRSDMDSWVAKHTDNMIKQMLDKPIDRDTMMYLVNALVFDAKWEKQYENNKVIDWTFTNINGTESSVKGLVSDESIYLSSEGIKGVAKSYKDGGYYFVGLLPEDETQDFSEFVSCLTGAVWQELWTNRSHERVRTMIPEFKTEDKTELNEILKNLGMERAFTDAAEFLPMASYNGQSLYVSEVVQKTYLELDRKGTKAAAVTWGAMNAKSAMPTEPKEVILDRPFVYLIVDAGSGLPLFVATKKV